MNNKDEFLNLVVQLKEHLQMNDGQIVYWGEKIPEVEGKTPDVKIGLNKNERLKILREETIGDCHLCPLGQTRIKLVFGVGNPEAKVMFVGEGPGFDEDRQGEPFVGKAGQLLDKIIASIGLNRSNVYIANIVKCHPMINPQTSEKRGNDRPPAPEEMEKCLPFLVEQIQIIQPQVIVALGATAAKALLKRREGITALRGKFHDFFIGDHGPCIPVLPTFHPAALLRDEMLKRPVWEDMKLLRDRLASSPSDDN